MSQMPRGMPIIVMSAIQATATTIPEAYQPMRSHYTNRARMSPAPVDDDPLVHEVPRCAFQPPKQANR